MQLLVLGIVALALMGRSSPSSTGMQHANTTPDRTTSSGSADHTAQDAAAVAGVLIDLVTKVYDAVKDD